MHWKKWEPMIRIWIKYTLMFVLVVLVQVLLLNQVQLSGYLNPYFYVLFILLLPVSTPRYAVLLLAFFVGFTIDIFSDTMGLHTASTVLLGYFRAPIAGLLSARESDQSDYPGLKQTGLRWFILYISILVLIHHFFLFYLEVFTFIRFFHTFIRAVFSSVFTVFIIVLSQFLVFRE
jgi:rod shape-determining protein MreD